MRKRLHCLWCAGGRLPSRGPLADGGAGGVVSFVVRPPALAGEGPSSNEPNESFGCLAAPPRGCGCRCGCGHDAAQQPVRLGHAQLPVLASRSLWIL